MNELLFFVLLGVIVGLLLGRRGGNVIVMPLPETDNRASCGCLPTLVLLVGFILLLMFAGLHA